MTAFITRLLNLIRFPLLLASVLLITGVIQFFIMQNDVKGQHFDLKLFQVSPETIRSVKTIEDTEQTTKDRDAAEEEVTPVYTYSEETGKNQIALVDTFFDYVLENQSKIKGETVKVKRKELEKQVKALKVDLDELLKDSSSVKLTTADIRLLLKSSSTEIKTAKSKITTAVSDQMSEPIRKSGLAGEKDTIERNIRYSSNFPADLRGIGVRVARNAIVVNETKDKKATDERIELARSNVDPTRILQGQIIVQEGQVIDRSIYHQLELTGLLTTHQSKKPLVGLGILILLQMIFFYSLFRSNKEKTDLIKTRDLLITSLVYLASVALMELFNVLDSEFDVIVGFIFPAAIAPLILRLLVSERIAILTTIMLGLAAGIIFQEGYSTIIQMEVSLYIIISGLAAIIFMRRIENRSKILKIGFQVAAINILYIAFYLLLTQTNYETKELLFYLIAAIASAVASCALTIGIIPFIESGFGIVSSFRLIELSNPNHPLLKKILMDAPGTYHHSIMVANLAEAACEEVGANGLLARVGCYYHDIGKTVRPEFFVENQMNGYNPHDELPPEASRDIIISHVVDGVKILEKHKMPKEIIDIAQQHHGTTLVKFFYFKAKELDESIDESKFRYAGPKPQTKENAIICVADSVEAAVRSLKEPNAEKIKKLVHVIAQEKLTDGQFDECDLSIKELRSIEKVFCETLNGTFHTRIEYPKES